MGIFCYSTRISANPWWLYFVTPPGTVQIHGGHILLLHAGSVQIHGGYILLLRQEQSKSMVVKQQQMPSVAELN